MRAPKSSRNRARLKCKSIWLALARTVPVSFARPLWPFRHTEVGQAAVVPAGHGSSCSPPQPLMRAQSTCRQLWSARDHAGWPSLSCTNSICVSHVGASPLSSDRLLAGGGDSARQRFVCSSAGVVSCRVELRRERKEKRSDEDKQLISSELGCAVAFEQTLTLTRILFFGPKRRGSSLSLLTLR